MKIYKSNRTKLEEIYKGKDQIVIKIGKIEITLIERLLTLDIYSDKLTIRPGASNNIEILLEPLAY